jgi:hypothetical protein
MELFSCTSCEKQFNNKNEYKKHINNKKDFCCNDNNIYICDICNKEFYRKYNFTRHRNNHCKNKNQESETMKELLSKIVEITQNKTLMENINAERSKELTTINSNNLNNSNNSNNTINSNNSNNVINSNNNNITIVQFGKEDLSKIDLLKLIDVYSHSTGGNIISNMLKCIHLNPQHPEFNSIYMSDFAREIVKIYDGNKFICKQFKKIKNSIIDKISKDINTLCDNYLKLQITDDKTIKQLHINDVSLKLINGIDAEDIVIDEIKNKKINTITDNVKTENTEEKEESQIILTQQDKNRIKHLDSKKNDLKEITDNNLKDTLYNNKNICIKTTKYAKILL